MLNGLTSCGGVQVASQADEEEILLISHEHGQAFGSAGDVPLAIFPNSHIEQFPGTSGSIESRRVIPFRAA